jgi:hypothetical protein
MSIFLAPLPAVRSTMIDARRILTRRPPFVHQQTEAREVDTPFTALGEIRSEDCSNRNIMIA